MFFLMDLCEGSLFDLLHKTRIKLKDRSARAEFERGILAQRPSFTLAFKIRRQLCKMCLEVAEGMEYLHNVSPPIIHRDMKTENILLAVRPTHTLAQICTQSH